MGVIRKLGAVLVTESGESGLVRAALAESLKRALQQVRFPGNDALEFH
jgi:hypothetical protein